MNKITIGILALIVLAGGVYFFTSTVKETSSLNKGVSEKIVDCVLPGTAERSNNSSVLMQDCIGQDLIDQENSNQRKIFFKNFTTEEKNQIISDLKKNHSAEYLMIVDGKMNIHQSIDFITREYMVDLCYEYSINDPEMYRCLENYKSSESMPIYYSLFDK